MQRELGLQVLPWVGQNPYTNPIENASSELKRRLRRRKVAPKTKTDPFAAFQEEWRAMPHSYFEKIAESMGRQCAAVVKGNGWPTKN